MNAHTYTCSSSPASSAACSSDASHVRSASRNRVLTACTYCRQRRIKCSGGEQCANCVRTGRSCSYQAIPNEVNQVTKARKAQLKSAKADVASSRSVRGTSASCSAPAAEIQGWTPAPTPARHRPFPSVLAFAPTFPCPSTFGPPSPTESTHSAMSIDSYFPATPVRSHAPFDYASPPPTPMIEQSPFAFSAPDLCSSSTSFFSFDEPAPPPSSKPSSAHLAGLGFAFPSSFVASHDLPASSVQLASPSKMDQFADASSSPVDGSNLWLQDAPEWTETPLEYVEVYEEIEEEVSVWGWGY